MTTEGNEGKITYSYEIAWNRRTQMGEKKKNTTNNRKCGTEGGVIVLLKRKTSLHCEKKTVARTREENE